MSFRVLDLPEESEFATELDAVLSSPSSVLSGWDITAEPPSTLTFLDRPEANPHRTRLAVAPSVTSMVVRILSVVVGDIEVRPQDGIGCVLVSDVLNAVYSAVDSAAIPSTNAGHLGTVSPNESAISAFDGACFAHAERLCGPAGQGLRMRVRWGWMQAVAEEYGVWEVKVEADWVPL